MKEALANMCVHVHISVNEFSQKFFELMRRNVYTTPKSYLDMLKLYLILLQKKQN